MGIFPKVNSVRHFLFYFIEYDCFYFVLSSKMNQPEFIPGWLSRFLANPQNPTIYTRFRIFLHWLFFLLCYSIYLHLVFQYSPIELLTNLIILGSVLAIFIYQPNWIPQIKGTYAPLLYWTIYICLYGYIVLVIICKRQLGFRNAKQILVLIILLYSFFSTYIAFNELSSIVVGHASWDD